MPWNSNQPRVPAGSPEGGHWGSGGGGGSSGKSPGGSQAGDWTSTSKVMDFLAGKKRKGPDNPKPKTQAELDAARIQETYNHYQAESAANQPQPMSLEELASNVDSGLSSRLDAAVRAGKDWGIRSFVKKVRSRKD